MEEFEFRLPKFLTQDEAKDLEWYNNYYAKRAKEQDLKVDIACEGGSIFLYHNSEFFAEGEYYPYWEMFRPNGPTCGTLNHVIERGLRHVLIKNFGGYDVFDLAIYFSRAYAYVLHASNTVRPEYDYKSFSSLWMKDKMLKRDPAQCELICACMVHCILDYEKDPHLQPLLQEIEWRLQASKNGINMDTLKVFQEKVTAAANEQTEENTPSEEQPMADTPLEKEEEAAPTLSDDEIKTAIHTLQKEGYLDEKVRYLGVHKVLVNRGVCSSNLSDFCRYLQKLGFAEERTHGAGMKRKTNDIYEVVKKIPSSFRDQRLSEWLSSREEQLPKHQKNNRHSKAFLRTYSFPQGINSFPQNAKLDSHNVPDIPTLFPSYTPVSF